MPDELEQLREENQKLREIADKINLEFIAKQFAFWDANIAVGAALAGKKNWLPDYDKGGMWAVFAAHALSGGKGVIDAKNSADLLIDAFENRYGRLGTVPPAD